MKRKGFLVCCTTFAEGPNHALAGSTMIAPSHPTAIAYPEHFQTADPGGHTTCEAHRRLLLQAQRRLKSVAPISIWGVDQ